MKKSEYVGLWHIYEMEAWGKDYFNMEVQAYIRIDKNSLGEFQFGLVSGQIDGRIVKYPEGERFEFTSYHFGLLGLVVSFRTCVPSCSERWGSRQVQNGKETTNATMLQAADGLESRTEI